MAFLRGAASHPRVLDQVQSWRIGVEWVGEPDDPNGHWVTHVRLHDLRHSCASLLLAQGVSARVAMEILGHSGIAITMNTYAHVLPTLLGSALDGMDELLSDDDQDPDEGAE